MENVARCTGSHAQVHVMDRIAKIERLQKRYPGCFDDMTGEKTALEYDKASLCFQSASGLNAEAEEPIFTVIEREDMRTLLKETVSRECGMVVRKDRRKPTQLQETESNPYSLILKTLVENCESLEREEDAHMLDAESHCDGSVSFNHDVDVSSGGS